MRVEMANMRVEMANMRVEMANMRGKVLLYSHVRERHTQSERRRRVAGPAVVAADEDGAVATLGRLAF